MLDHVRAERRRRYPPLLHLGRPGGLDVVVPATAADGQAELDHALRVDVLAAALHRLRHLTGEVVPAQATPLVWLSRCGELDLQDLDAAWLAAATAAFAEAQVDLTLVVVTRQGWCDPRTGVGVTWRRVRVR